VVALLGLTVVLLNRDSPAGHPCPAMSERPCVRLAVAGDTGTGDEQQLRTVAAMQQAQDGFTFDALLLLGDLVYEVGDPERVDEAVLEPFAPLVDEGVNLVPVLGNHDVVSDGQDEILRLLGESHNYYVEYVGSLRIIVLDSNEVDDDQTAWLRQVLGQSPAGVRWTIAAMHHPAYSAGEHGSDLEVREAWSPLFAEFDVPLVLAGHDHDYQRSDEIAGVTYVVSGGGAKLRATGSEDFTAVSESVLHFLDVAVYDDRLEVRAIGQDGELVDQFTIR